MYKVEVAFNSINSYLLYKVGLCQILQQVYFSIYICYLKLNDLRRYGLVVFRKGFTINK